MNVIVWEWEEMPTTWIPYSPQASCFLESCLTSGQTNVNLGQVDPNLSCYDVDLKTRIQTRRETGKTFLSPESNVMLQLMVSDQSSCFCPFRQSLF